MCATCGCGNGAKTTVLDLQTGTLSELQLQEPHDHYHADGTWHSHSHGDHEHDHSEDHAHDHHHRHGHGDVLTLETRILAKNDALAQNNRAWFAGREILALNLVSAPGSGKTTLLERTIAALGCELPIQVIEGDREGSSDSQRIRQAGAPVVQVNTGTGCHIDANMVASGISALKPPAGALVFIENVGNLVCPALFDLGERAKVVIFSTTEGEDKPLKYPHMFRAAQLVVLNKIDLAPHLDFGPDTAIGNIHKANPGLPVLQPSARTGDGLEGWFDWLRGERQAARDVAFQLSGRAKRSDIRARLREVFIMCRDIVVRVMLGLAALCFAPTIALAHPGFGPHTGLVIGFLHPLTGVDHILAMIAVGVFAANLGRCALWAVPLTFTAIMALGGALGSAWQASSCPLSTR